MRRKDRQVIDPARMEAILRRAACVRLGLVDQGLAYIVPMSFGVEKEDGKLCLYFHSAPEGRKIDLIEQAGVASFEADTDYALQAASQACAYSCYYQSVMGYGKISVLRDEEQKLRALRSVMEHYTGNADWEILQSMLPRVVGIRLEIDEMTAKARMQTDPDQRKSTLRGVRLVWPHALQRAKTL